jgi:hypothetical protein
LGLQAQSDAAREVFPIRVTQGRLRLVSYLHCSSNLQQQTNRSASPTNYGGCQSPTACKINKTKGNSENKVFGERTKSKTEQK